MSDAFIVLHTHDGAVIMNVIYELILSFHESGVFEPFHISGSLCSIRADFDRHEPIS